MMHTPCMHTSTYFLRKEVPKDLVSSLPRKAKGKGEKAVSM